MRFFYKEPTKQSTNLEDKAVDVGLWADSLKAEE